MSWRTNRKTRQKFPAMQTGSELSEQMQRSFEPQMFCARAGCSHHARFHQPECLIGDLHCDAFISPVPVAPRSESNPAPVEQRVKEEKEGEREAEEEGALFEGGEGVLEGGDAGFSEPEDEEEHEGFW